MSNYWDIEWPEPPKHPLKFSACPRLGHIVLSSRVMGMLCDGDLIRTLPKSVKVIGYCPFTDPNTVLDLLLRCGDFEKLNLFCSSGVNQQLPEEIGFQRSHTSLRYFSLLLNSYNTRVQPLFRAIQFHSLVALSLKHIKDPAGAFECIAAASPPLEYMELLCVSVPLDELLALFRRLPTITELSMLRCRCFDSMLISALTLFSPDTTPYLPNLQRSTIGKDRGRELRVGNRELVSFIESRWRVRMEGCTRMNYVHIWDYRTLEDEWRQSLSVKSEG
ncbi:hypothetical protein AX16_009282 [Volvariella volvacea WC 439]|nr:hypothetical protein AX16_009282 [Volvariella volvacea WC 439]